MPGGSPGLAVNLALGPSLRKSVRVHAVNNVIMGLNFPAVVFVKKTNGRASGLILKPLQTAGSGNVNIDLIKSHKHIFFPNNFWERAQL